MTTILHIAPIPKLAELREAVLAHSEKRKPKWGFRIAPDIVMELQAQPCMLVSPGYLAQGGKQAVVKFEGHAVMAENASAESLQRHPRGGRQRSFSLLQFDGEPNWQLALKGWRRPLNDDPRHLERLDAAIVAALQGDGIFTRLTPERMLKPACMLCGKGLKPCRVVPKFQGTATVINWNILDAVGLIAAKRMAEPWRWETAEPPPAGCPCSWSGSCSRKRTAARRRRSRRSRLTHGHSDEPASDPDPSPRTSRTPRPICPRHCAVKCTRP